MKSGIKRSIISGVVAVALTATMAIPAMAAELTIQEQMKQVQQNAAQPTEQTTPLTFRDIPSTHWAYSSISAMTAKGLFGGKVVYDDNTALFAPDDTMTRAEFTVVVVRALYKSELDAMPPASPWWSNAYKVALDKGILQSNELENGTMNKGMSRQEMALVLVRAAEQLGQSPSQLVSTGKIADYSTVGTYYKDSVVKAYSMGMLAGTDSKGTYSPTATMNRAQGAAVLNRLVDSSSRIKVDFTNPAPVETQGTIQQSDAYRKTALAGDTFVKLDGTKVVLKVDQASGVLGYGQGVATDLGRIIAGQNNQAVKHGFQISGTECDTPYHKDNAHPDGGASYRGQTYKVNPYNNEGHWSGDWGLISQTYRATLTTQGSFDGQLSKDKNFYWDDLAESWNLVINALEYVQSVNPTGK